MLSLKTLFAAVITVLAFTSLTAAAKSVGTITGLATAKDGDDIFVQGIDIRLQGIAAPEDNTRKREPGGPEATANLHRLVDGKEVVCHPDGTKARGRPVAICLLGGKDIGELQVEQGFARDCPRYSGGRYAQAEQRAKAAGRNLSATYALPSYCS